MTIYEYTDEESPTGGTVYTYGYTNSAWGDQLTSYRGQSITYDAVGNPLTYYNGQSYTFTWEGRLLVGATVGDKVMTFTYNDEGIRTSKTVNGVTTNYYLDGSRIVGEETNGNIKLYFYDASGAPIGMEYHGADYAEDVWDLYWYGKNLQGDVTAVYRNDGLYIYGYYSAFGDTYEDDFMFYADFNPFRYRGYYYDSDLGMYYLNSRYYDTNTCRFINADGYVSTGTGLLGYNMYAYCNNNPIKYVDPSGRSIIGAILICCLIGGSVVALSSCGKDVDDLSEKEQKAIDFANNVDDNPRAIEQTVDYSFDTDDFLESVAPEVRDVFYERLYERSKEIAEEAEIGTDNLMSVEHIKWEVEIHLMGYGIFSACDKIDLNYEETYGSLCDRAIKAVDDKITEFFGGDIPWIIPQ